MKLTPIIRIEAGIKNPYWIYWGGPNDKHVECPTISDLLENIRLVIGDHLKDAVKQANGIIKLQAEWGGQAQ